jgi:hypothetical protein
MMKQKILLCVYKLIAHLARFRFFVTLPRITQFEFVNYLESCDLIYNVLKKSWRYVFLMDG